MEIEEQKAAAEESEGREAKMRLEAEQRLEQIKVIFSKIKVKAFFFKGRSINYKLKMIGIIFDLSFVLMT